MLFLWRMSMNCVKTQHIVQASHSSNPLKRRIQTSIYLLKKTPNHKGRKSLSKNLPTPRTRFKFEKLLLPRRRFVRLSLIAQPLDQAYSPRPLMEQGQHLQESVWMMALEFHQLRLPRMFKNR